jgi:prepilin-type processing-associated H-X9-DG protein
MEKGAYGFNEWKDAAIELPTQKGYSQAYTEKTLRHGIGNNFLFVDGHVKWYAWAQGPWAEEGQGAAACPGGIPGLGIPDHEPGHCVWPEDWPVEQ